MCSKGIHNRPLKGLQTGRVKPNISRMLQLTREQSVTYIALKWVDEKGDVGTRRTSNQRLLGSNSTSGCRDIKDSEKWKAWHTMGATAGDMEDTRRRRGGYRWHGNVFVTFDRFTGRWQDPTVQSINSIYNKYHFSYPSVDVHRTEYSFFFPRSKRNYSSFDSRLTHLYKFTSYFPWCGNVFFPSSYKYVWQCLNAVFLMTS